MRALLHKELGTGPHLAYIPGIDGTGELLLDTANRLAKHWHVLCLRYVGKGEDSYEALANSVLQVLEQAGVQDAVLVAESFGGGLALQVALTDPSRVRALMIVNSFCYCLRRLRLALTRLSAPLAQGPLFRLGRRYFGSAALIGKDATDEERRLFHSKSGTALDAAYRRRLGMIPRLDLRARLAEIQQPVQLIAAGRDRVVDSYASAELMLAGLPNAELRRLPESGHLVLPLSAHPWVDWLEELEGRASTLASGGQPAQS
ncbi:MAG: hypothetical protein CSA62_07880 [Planctomycetota bacterium]|nr:MAG: hypothetical protein CSA62_07880 [Planctomycetota bacterium]